MRHRLRQGGGGGLLVRLRMARHRRVRVAGRREKAVIAKLELEHPAQAQELMQVLG